MAVHIYHEFDFHTVHSITSFIFKKQNKKNKQTRTEFHFFTLKLDYNLIALPSSCFRKFLLKKKKIKN